MNDFTHIDEQIKTAKKKLAALEATRAALVEEINRLEGLKNSMKSQPLPADVVVGSEITNESPEKKKLSLFRSLFRGREDIFAKRFESKRTGKSGYQPVCRNEWIRPFCQKPKVRCAVCENRDFAPLADDVIRNHLIGKDPADRYQREFVIGI